MLLGNDINTVKNLYVSLIEAANNVGLYINEIKTEYILVKRRGDERQVENNSKMRFYKFKNVTQLKYLSTTITQLNNMEIEIIKTIPIGNTP